MHPSDDPDPCRDLSPPEGFSNSRGDYKRPAPPAQTFTRQRFRCVTRNAGCQLLRNKHLVICDLISSFLVRAGAPACAIILRPRYPGQFHSLRALGACSRTLARFRVRFFAHVHEETAFDYRHDKQDARAAHKREEEATKRHATLLASRRTPARHRRRGFDGNHPRLPAQLLTRRRGSKIARHLQAEPHHAHLRRRRRDRHRRVCVRASHPAQVRGDSAGRPQGRLGRRGRALLRAHRH
jgi:hypothetical protein